MNHDANAPRVEGRELVRFIVLSFVLGFASQLPALLNDVRGAGKAWLGLTMWTPTIAALLAGPTARRAIWAHLRRGSFRFWLPAIVIGMSVYLVQALLLMAFGGDWNQAVFEVDSTRRVIVAVHGLRMMLGVGEQSYAFFALNLAVTLGVASLLFGVIGGLGEEIGWRGLLHSEAVHRHGQIKGTILLSLVWAYWHLPANLMGYNDPIHPVLNSLLLFPLHTLALSFGFGWLTQKTGSVWPAAFAHGANNAIAAGFVMKPDGWAQDQLTVSISCLTVALFFAWQMCTTGSGRQGKKKRRFENDHKNAKYRTPTG